MTVGKLSALCWTVFVIMSVGVFGLLDLVANLHLSGPLRDVLLVLPILLWWGPFGYAMYLALVVMRAGDPRLLKRGIRGTALVLSAKQTNTTIQEGERDWQAPFVYRYHLKVSLPGRQPYDTYCSICLDSVEEGQTVDVAASKWNRKRVTIDAGQGGGRRASARSNRQAALQAALEQAKSGGGARVVSGDGVELGSNAALGGIHIEHLGGTGGPSVVNIPSSGQAAASPDEGRLDALEKLGQLHASGVLTDAEFASEKAKILGEG